MGRIITVAKDHPEITGTTTFKFGYQRTPAVVRAVRYTNPAGLAAHNDNFYTGVLKNGTTLISSLFNTELDQSGASIAAGAWIQGVLEASPAEAIAAGEELSLVCTKGGTQTLPAGRVEVDLEVL